MAGELARLFLRIEGDPSRRGAAIALAALNLAVNLLAALRARHGWSDADVGAVLDGAANGVTAAGHTTIAEEAAGLLVALMESSALRVDGAAEGGRSRPARPGEIGPGLRVVVLDESGSRLCELPIGYVFRLIAQDELGRQCDDVPAGAARLIRILKAQAQAGARRKGSK